MNSVEDTHKLLLEEQEIDFAKRGPKPEIIFTTVTIEKVMTQISYENVGADEIETVFKASQIFHMEIEDMGVWHYSRSFVDFKTPMKPQQFFKWVISAPQTDLNVDDELWK